MTNPINIKRELQRKNTDKFVDELLKEVERSTNHPFEMQLVHVVQRKLMHLLDDARARGDEQARVQQVLEVFLADVICSYIQLSVPPQNAEMVIKVANGMLASTSDILSQQLHGYIQPPPPSH
jgi:hypothetical protein